MAVIRPEIETDPEALERIATDYLSGAVPGWEPADGDLMTWLISAHARMVAEERDIAADVPIEQILRPLGEHVHGVVPRVATPASVTAVVTLRDDRGYTIPAGTEMLVRTSGDDGVTMAVAEDVTVPPPSGGRGTTTTDVILRAIAGREGSAGNGLDDSNPVIPLRPLEFIASVALKTGVVSSGGGDAETDEQYLERLVDTLALTTPAPILPDDFAKIARQQDGVSRALAINNRLLREEILEIEAAARTALSITDGEARTYEIPADATAVAVRALFASYDAIGEGGPLGRAPISLSLRNRARYGSWRLSVPAGGNGSITTVQRGGEQAVRERAITVVVVGPDGATVARSTRRTVEEALEAVRELNWEISVIDPTLNDVDVDFMAVARPTYDPLVVQSAAIEALRAYLSPARWGLGEGLGEDAGNDWVDEPVLRYLEVAQVLQEVPGVRYVTRLQLGLHGRTLGAADVRLTGPGGLPRPGAGITGTVTEG